MQLLKSSLLAKVGNRRARAMQFQGSLFIYPLYHVLNIRARVFSKYFNSVKLNLRVKFPRTKKFPHFCTRFFLKDLNSSIVPLIVLKTFNTILT